jgi:hypothetical protein
MTIRLCAVAWSQTARKFVHIDVWSERGNTHLFLIERKPRAGILTPASLKER